MMQPITQFEPGKRYKILTEDHGVKRTELVFVERQRGDGVEHYVFRHPAGKYLVSFTNIDLAVAGN